MADNWHMSSTAIHGPRARGGRTIAHRPPRCISVRVPILKAPPDGGLSTIPIQRFLLQLLTESRASPRHQESRFETNGGVLPLLYAGVQGLAQELEAAGIEVDLKAQVLRLPLLPPSHSRQLRQDCF